MVKLPENEVFYCEHINDKKENAMLISDFTVKYKSGENLVSYLVNVAIHDEYKNTNRTYLVKDCITNEIVAYFSLKAGLVSLDESQVDNEFDTVPGVELAQFAVNSSYSLYNKVKGIGEIVFYYFILPIVKEISKDLGVSFLYIFALPEERLINHYKDKLHFKRLSHEEEEKLHSRIKPRYDESCIFMYQSLNE